MQTPDTLISHVDNALRTIAGVHHASRPMPRPAQGAGTVLSAAEREQAAALMRVNHVGEVCAQALYQAQSALAREPAVRHELERAAREEGDHLAWTRERIAELGGRTSWLVPAWYAGAYAIGLGAAWVGDKASLGFVAETERQVEAHLASHLDRLPAADTASRAIVSQMREDEARHARMAQAQGALELPSPVKLAMKLAARVMTTTAHRI